MRVHSAFRGSRRNGHARRGKDCGGGFGHPNPQVGKWGSPETGTGAPLAVRAARESANFGVLHGVSGGPRQKRLMGAAEFEGRKWYFRYEIRRQNKLVGIMRAVRFWDIVLTTLHDAHAPWANRLNPLNKPFRLRDRIVQLSFSLLPPGARIARPPAAAWEPHCPQRPLCDFRAGAAFASGGVRNHAAPVASRGARAGRKFASANSRGRQSFRLIASGEDVRYNSSLTRTGEEKPCVTPVPIATSAAATSSRARAPAAGT